MLKVKQLRPEYVTHVPEKLDAGVLYISEEFETAGHLCCCGCGEEVFTPLNKAQWQLIKNVRTGSVSLEPSVGNWKYACRSHYWIRNNQVIDAGPLSDRKIELVIQRDRRDKEVFVKAHNNRSANAPRKPGRHPDARSENLLIRFLRWLVEPTR
jgi:hypothetical protein